MRNLLGALAALLVLAASSVAVADDLGDVAGKAAIVRGMTDRKSYVGGGLVFEFRDEQFVITNLHAALLRAVISVEVLGGGKAEAKRVWPPEETPRDLAILLVSKRVSESPLDITDFSYSDAGTLTGAFFVGGAPNGRVAREPVYLSEAKNFGRRYWFFVDNFAYGASGTPVFSREEGRLVLAGLIAGNDGTLADGTKIKGGMAYTVRPLQAIVGEYLASRRRAALQ